MESLLLETALHSSVGVCPSSVSSESISAANPFGLPYNHVLSGLLLFLSSHVGTDAFISNISLGSSQSWYFRIGQFELVFLGIIMLQLCVLRYLEIMPININNLFLGDPSGRRRKRSVKSSKVNFCRKDEMVESMLQLLRKLDEDECLPLVLCKLQSISRRGDYFYNSTTTPLGSEFFTKEKFKVPDQTKRLLNALNASGKTGEESLAADEESCSISENMIYFKNAVHLGDSSHEVNSTICHDTYNICSLSDDEIVAYVSVIGNAEMV